VSTRKLATPAAEIRRLRAERDELLHQRDEALHLLGALVDAQPDPLAEIEYRRALCREAAEAARERAWGEGYVAAVADIKRTEHDLVDAARLAGLRARPAGAAWLAAAQRNNATEYGGEGKPRVQVPAGVIDRARESRAA
jgi:hypothetical protein